MSDNNSNENAGERLKQLKQQASASGGNRLTTSSESNTSADDTSVDTETRESKSVDDANANANADAESEGEGEGEGKSKGEIETDRPSDRSFADVLDEQFDGELGHNDPHISVWSPTFAPLFHALDADDETAHQRFDELRAFAADEMDKDPAEINHSRAALIEEAIHYFLLAADEADASDALQQLREAKARDAMGAL